MVAVSQTTHLIYKNLDERGILGAALAAAWTLHPSGTAAHNVTAKARKLFGISISRPRRVARLPKRGILSGVPYQTKRFLLSHLKPKSRFKTFSQT